MTSFFFSVYLSQDRGRRRWSQECSGHPAAALHHQVWVEGRLIFNLLTKFKKWKLKLKKSCWCHLSPDCRSFPSSLWTTEPSFLGQVTSLTSSFPSNPRMHHLPALTYSTQPSPYGSYLSSPPPPPPLSHSGPFQPGSYYNYGPNQPLQTAGEDRNVITALSNYIEGACLSLRGEEPVWRPYWLWDVIKIWFFTWDLDILNIFSSFDLPVKNILCVFHFYFFR